MSCVCGGIGAFYIHPYRRDLTCNAKEGMWANFFSVINITWGLVGHKESNLGAVTIAISVER